MGLVKLKKNKKVVGAKPATNNDWTVQNGGVIANKYGFVGLQDEAAYKAAKLIEQGRIIVTVRDLQIRLDIGRVADSLREILRKRQFWKKVEQYWFDGSITENQKRDLQQSMQMYKFSVSEGKYIQKDIPVDSYIHIMRAVNSVKEKKERKKLTMRIAKTKRFEGICLKKTKEIRQKMQEMKDELIDANNDNLAEKIMDRESKNLANFIDSQVQYIDKRIKRFKNDYGDRGFNHIKNNGYGDRIIGSLISTRKTIKSVVNKISKTDEVADEK